MARVFASPVTHCDGLVRLLLLLEIHRDACGGPVVGAIVSKSMRQAAHGRR
jgi:hypothetical protein